MESTLDLPQWELTDDDRECVAQEIIPLLHKKLMEIQGDQLRPKHEIRKLSTYWACSLIGNINRFHYQNISRREFEILSSEQRLNTLLHQTGVWNRGIDKYVKMAGEPLLLRINESIARKGTASLLDIGCGDFAFCREVKEKYGKRVQCYGIAPRIPAIPEDVHFVNTLAEVLPYSWSDRFDIVTCFESSMYFYNGTRAFEEAVRVTSPDGDLWYGCGAFKDIGDENLLERLLDMKEYVYQYPAWSTRVGEEYTGIFARWVSQSEHLLKAVFDAEAHQEHQTILGNVCIQIKKFSAPSWCPTTLKMTKVRKNFKSPVSL